MHHRLLRRSSLVVLAAAVALPAGAALAQVPTPQLPPVPTVTLPVPVPTVTPPVPVPKLPDVPVPDLPVPAPPDVPDVPSVPVPGVPALPAPGGGGSGSGGGSGAGSQPAGGGSAPASGGGRASGGSDGSGGGTTSGAGGSGGGGAAGAGGGATSAAGGAAGSAPGRAGSGRERRARGRRANAAPTPRARRERRLRRVVAQLAGCLDDVAAVERRVLVLRAGAGSRRPLSRQAVAARLDAPVRRVARTERRGVRHLRAAARSGACGGFEAGAGAAAAGDGGAGGAPGSAVLVRDDPIAGGERIGTARSGVKNEFATGPAPSPGTLLPPGSPGSLAEGGGRGMSVPLLLLAAFVAGFALVWTLESRRGGARAA